MEQTFAQKAFDFYSTLMIPATLPAGVTAMNPYQDATTRTYSKLFLEKYFADHRKRIFVFGINPGRFGAGLTGVTFTDPVALEKFCGIHNEFPKRREISSEFIYKIIDRWGGVHKFYHHFFLTAVCPLGFTKEGKNYNFYDHKEFLDQIKPFLIQTIRQQISFGADRHAAIVLGSGKNYKIFSELNREGNFFKKIYPLDHPRFILQYRRRLVEKYVEKYQKVLAEASASSKTGGI